MFEAIVEPVSSDSNPTNTPLSSKPAVLRTAILFRNNGNLFLVLRAKYRIQLMIESPEACLTVAIQPIAYKKV